MNVRIPLGSRLTAAALQLSGIVLAGSIAILLSSAIFNKPIAESIATILIFVIICSPTAGWILWLITKKMHPFVDRSGKDAINCALTIWMVLVCCLGLYIFVFFITCGNSMITNPSGNRPDKTLEWIAIVFDWIAIAYVLNSVVAGMFALGGYRFKSFLIYPFIRDD